MHKNRFKKQTNRKKVTNKHFQELILRKYIALNLKINQNFYI